MAANYTIRLPHFEGPFDLLLFFIERDELDIYDIPIAQVTHDFLAYIRQLERMNIDLASEFILVAATLCRIKAKLLLPRKPVDEEGREIDPREELVERLLEYKRYKSVLDDMRQLEENRFLRNSRGNAADELQVIATRGLVDAEMESVTLFKLLRAFERVVQRMEYNNQKLSIHRVVRFNYSIEEAQEHILSLISRQEQAGFDEIFAVCTDRIQAIIVFLGLLELLNLQQVHLQGGDQVNQFWIVLHPGEDEDFSSAEEEE
jgi:segregation and condensation protein A